MFMDDVYQGCIKFLSNGDDPTLNGKNSFNKSVWLI